MTLGSLCALAFVLSVVACGVVMVSPLRDAPDGGRKTQDRPIPTSGGLGILVGAVGAILIAALLDANFGQDVLTGMTRTEVLPLVVVALGAAGVGLVDDAAGLPALIKLAALAVLAGVAANLLPLQHLFTLLPGGPLPEEAGSARGTGIYGLVALAGVALWIFVMANAANFMDGSNGIAVGSLAIMFAGLIGPLVAVALGDGGAVGTVFVASAATLAAASVGFLIWNVPGRLYAGDAGALMLGGAFAVLGVISAERFTAWLPATLALPFLVDVFMTLIWRARRGRNLLRPHRDHAYQLFLHAGWSHFRVALVWWAFSLVCAIAGLLAAGASATTGFLAFALLCSFGIVLWIWQRAALKAFVDA